MVYGIVLLAPWPLPSCGKMGWVVGLCVGCLRVRLGFFFLEFVEVSVLSLVVHSWGGGFSYGLHCTSLEVFFLFIVFRPVRSSVVSTHSTGRCGVGQGQQVLAQWMRDGL